MCTIINWNRIEIVQSRVFVILKGTLMTCVAELVELNSNMDWLRGVLR